MTELEKCSHSSCGCDVPGDADYCSPYCRRSGKASEDECNCGHAGCVDEAVDEAEESTV